MGVVDVAGREGVGRKVNELIRISECVEKFKTSTETPKSATRFDEPGRARGDACLFQLGCESVLELIFRAKTTKRFGAGPM